MEYLVTFDLSGNPQGGATLKQVRVGVEGFSQEHGFDSTGQTLDALVWQSVAFSFTALGDAATLSFTSLSSSPSSYGPLIDNVNVTPVPEPSSILLLGGGFAAAGFQRKFRRP